MSAGSKGNGWGDSITWTANNTGYKAIDGVTVKGKIDKAGEGMAARNISDAKADLKGDYDKCQLLVTGTFSLWPKPATCQEAVIGRWFAMARKGDGTWQVSSGPAAMPSPGRSLKPEQPLSRHQHHRKDSN
jgi:hypothetical protein